LIFSRQSYFCRSVNNADQKQFHWQDYELKQDYILTVDILNQLKGEGLIAAIGLCNFDSLRTEEICTQFPGVVVSNQVQVQFLCADISHAHRYYSSR
jgi:diketogulonate reductase-like aldo/keto reductase